MKEIKPKFELSRVFSDGTEEEAQIVPLTEAVKAKMNRRGLGAGMTAAAAILILDGCGMPRAVSPGMVPVESSVRCNTKKAHNNIVTGLAMHPDGKMFFSGSHDKTWSLPEGAHIKTLTGHSDTINSLAVSPDGKQLFSGSGDSTIKIWSLEKTLTGQGAVWALAVSPDGRWLVSVYGKKGSPVDIWSLPDGTLFKTLTGRMGLMQAMAVTPDGSRLLLGGRDRSMIIWNFPQGTVRRKWGKSKEINSFSATPDGRILLTGDRDGNIRLRNLSNGAILKSLKAHDKNTWQIAVSPDGSRFVSGSYDATLKLWSLPNASLIKTVNQEGRVFSLAISPDGQWLVSGLGMGIIKLWHMPDVSYENCMLDLACVSDKVEGSTYDVTDEHGHTVTYTLPCGSPIPPGAICVCNCVPRSMCTCNSYSSNRYRSTGGGCSCNQVCTCNRVCTCLAILVRY
jgi:WD40 repeat protein